MTPVGLPALITIVNVQCDTGVESDGLSNVAPISNLVTFTVSFSSPPFIYPPPALPTASFSSGGFFYLILRFTISLLSVAIYYLSTFFAPSSVLHFFARGL